MKNSRILNFLIFLATWYTIYWLATSLIGCSGVKIVNENGDCLYWIDNGKRIECPDMYRKDVR